MKITLIFLLAIIVLLIVLSYYFAKKYLKYKNKLKSLNFEFDSPIKKIKLDELAPIFKPNQFGPTLNTLVTFLGKGNLTVVGGTSDSEAWILSVLAKKSTNIFEFGTCTGKSSLLFALNSPADSNIITLTLKDDNLLSYSKDESDSEIMTKTAISESKFTNFIYDNTEVSHKITQIFGDSKEFDESPYLNNIDLIFIDGSHAYSYVESDTKKALNMLRSGGIIIWHDYRGPHHESIDVFNFLNKLSKDLELWHLADTSMVAFKKV